jgi:hypothetical protein
MLENYKIVEVSVVRQLHASETLLPGKKSPVFITQKAV